MRKPCIISATLLISLSLLYGESKPVGGQWRGLHDGDTSILIDDNEAQSILNVDITDTGFGVTKRAGYSSFKTVSTSTWGIRGLYYFRNANAEDTIVAAHNTSLFKSVNGAAFSSFYTTGTAGAYYDCTESNGTLYCLDSSNDPLVTYNGTILNTYSS